MRVHSFTLLSDAELLRVLARLLARDRTTTAAILACFAEVDARQLWRPAGYPSMFEYCVHQLRLSEDAAYKRIQAARATRRFPALYPVLASGRLHLSGVVLLAPHLTPENAAELIAAASGKTKAEIELMLARRFPRPDRPSRLVALPRRRELAPAQVSMTGDIEGDLLRGLDGSSSAALALYPSCRGFLLFCSWLGLGR